MSAYSSGYISPWTTWFIWSVICPNKAWKTVLVRPFWPNGIWPVFGRQYIYIIFYILLLEKAPKSAKIATNIEIGEETENEYKVEEILDTNKISGKPYYLVK